MCRRIADCPFAEPSKRHIGGSPGRRREPGLQGDRARKRTSVRARFRLRRRARAVEITSRSAGNAHSRRCVFGLRASRDSSRPSRVRGPAIRECRLPITLTRLPMSLPLPITRLPMQASPNLSRPRPGDPPIIDYQLPLPDYRCLCHCRLPITRLPMQASLRLTRLRRLIPHVGDAKRRPGNRMKPDRLRRSLPPLHSNVVAERLQFGRSVRRRRRSSRSCSRSGSH